MRLVQRVARWLTALAIATILSLGSSARAQEGAAAVPAADASAPATRTAGGLSTDMKLEDLVKQDVVVKALSQQVTTVTRQESTVRQSAAAVFVITPEMIKRSGVRSIPEALRMAPGIDVAKVDSSTWAISARGFNNRFANKLLVQIDGRIVYNATFGGVYWKMQDVVLADVDRIEVIRGPGTTTWGSNAMNGVINVITKKSSETQGVLMQSGGGNQERNFNTVRYGARASEDLTWRAYGQQFDRNIGWSGTGIGDAWSQQRGGFRADYTPEQDTLTLQGDIFNVQAGDRFLAASPTFPYQDTINDRTHAPGGNVLFRWGRAVDDETSWQFQTYFDRYSSNQVVFAETRNTYDVDFQYQFSPAQWHQVIAGANYRISQDDTRGTFSYTLVPLGFTTQWASVFAADTMTLYEDRLFFTLGTRLEQNTFGHFQVEPTARLLYTPNERSSAWMAVSRAVRNPTRVDVQSFGNNVVTPGVPLFIQFSGNPSFLPENMIAYEVGYRSAPTDDFSWDIAGYINAYEQLEGTSPPGAPILVPPNLVFLPTQFENNVRAVSYGFEVTANYRCNDCWRLFGSYSLFQIDANSTDSFAAAQLEGSSPKNQIYLRSTWDLSDDIEFDLIGRYVDRLSALEVPKYIEMDARLGWQATKNVEVSLVGQNLLNPHHLEFVDVFGGMVSTQVRRGYYGMVSWAY